MRTVERRKNISRRSTLYELPDFIAPQLATLSSSPPKGQNWIFEEKLDGYRILARVDQHQVTLQSRNQKDWTRRFQEVVESLSKLSLNDAILDGEIVALDEKNRPSFQILQNSLSGTTPSNFRYYVFDLLWINGQDIRRQSLLDRKRLLKRFVFKNKARIGTLFYLEHSEGSAEKLMQQACRKGFEGLICKKLDSSYLSGRTLNWLKLKCTGSEEFVICGFTKLKLHTPAIGALILGQYIGRKLSYCGRVGTGFSLADRRDFYKALLQISRHTSAFHEKPPQSRGVHWVEPLLVAQVKFTERTSGGLLRHPSFEGLREDKKATEVHHEFAKAHPG